MDKTKVAVSAIIAFVLLFLLVIVVAYFSRDDTPREDLLEEQIREKNEEIVALKAQVQKYSNEIKGLIAEVARLNAVQPGGTAVEELREALATKESEQQHKENRLVAREEAVRLAELKVDKLQQEFYEKTGMKLEEIGEAKQIRKEYENMRADRQHAEEKANMWLIYFVVLLTAFFGCVIAIVIAKLKMDAKSKNIQSACRIVDSINLRNEDKQLLMSSLGRELIDATTQQNP